MALLQGNIKQWYFKAKSDHFLSIFYLPFLYPSALVPSSIKINLKKKTEKKLTLE